MDVFKVFVKVFSLRLRVSAVKKNYGNTKKNNQTQTINNGEKTAKHNAAQTEFGIGGKFSRAVCFYRRDFILSGLFDVYGLSHGNGFGFFRCQKN